MNFTSILKLDLLDGVDHVIIVEVNMFNENSTDNNVILGFADIHSFISNIPIHVPQIICFTLCVAFNPDVGALSF